jgi:DNA recombination protein RmuC
VGGPLRPEVLLALLPVAALALWWAVRQAVIQGRIRDTLLRLDARIEEQARRAEGLHAQIEGRARHTEDLVRALDRSLRDRQAGLQQALERRLGEMQAHQAGHLAETRTRVAQAVGQLGEEVRAGLAEQQVRSEQRQLEALRGLARFLQGGIQGMQRQVGESLARSAEELGRRVEALTATAERQLGEISGRVDLRLGEGLDRTSAVFTDIRQRLAVIDEAQRRIADLSGQVLSLQEVLTDKRSRGAFGEVQLAALVGNVLPASGYALQHTLPNGTRVDCALFLPEPTGTVGVDAKFPLESYRRMLDPELAPAGRREAARQFRQDIRRHIHDIAGKYILPGTTAQGAVMFIPAEAVFAEIHAHHPELVAEAQAAHVWMCSPTTLLAVLNTALAVLKDDATRRQVHVLREHLAALARDFERFRARMDSLARHIGQAQRDVGEVHGSAERIAQAFGRIERVELDDPAGTTPPG